MKYKLKTYNLKPTKIIRKGILIYIFPLLSNYNGNDVNIFVKSLPKT